MPTLSGTVTFYTTANCVIPRLKIATGQTVDLSPGTYWLTGNLKVEPTGVLKCSACDNVNGIGVTIILTTRTSTIGYVSMTDGVVDLNAPGTVCRACDGSGCQWLASGHNLPLDPQQHHWRIRRYAQWPRLLPEFFNDISWKSQPHRAEMLAARGQLAER